MINRKRWYVIFGEVIAHRVPLIRTVAALLAGLIPAYFLWGAEKMPEAAYWISIIVGILAAVSVIVYYLCAHAASLDYKITKKLSLKNLGVDNGQVLQIEAHNDGVDLAQNCVVILKEFRPAKGVWGADRPPLGSPLGVRDRIEEQNNTVQPGETILNCTGEFELHGGRTEVIEIARVIKEGKKVRQIQIQYAQPRYRKPMTLDGVYHLEVVVYGAGEPYSKKLTIFLIDGLFEYMHDWHIEPPKPSRLYT